MSLIALNSDFTDYYDHCFAGSWQSPAHEFDRLTTGGMSRREMLKWFDEVGFLTPTHGLVRDLVAPDCDGQLVVYTDENVHCGEGKIKLFASEALQHHPDCYATIYIPSSISPKTAESYRLLRIGSRAFWLRYTSLNDWRSNCGDGYSVVLCEFKLSEKMAEWSYPLFAIDFVKRDREMLAIDFNKAPGLRGSGIEEHMRPQQVYHEIAKIIAPELYQ